MPTKVDKTDDQWKETLSPEQYAVARQGGTEPPFSGKYYDEKSPGVYRCACCGQALFDSETKYDSGSGWPSYYAPIEQGAVATRDDTSHGMRRTEVLCSACDAHLGHVFEDGPAPTGLRYCINSVCLELEKKK